MFGDDKMDIIGSENVGSVNVGIVNDPVLSNEDIQESKRQKIPIENKIESFCPQIVPQSNEINSPYNLQNADMMLTFAITNNLLEILDAAHDLACDEDQENPLVTYCQNNIERDETFIFINNTNIQVNQSNNPSIISGFLENMSKIKRSQNAIKNHMKEIIQELDPILVTELKRQPYFESTLIKDGKKLTDLQITLSEMGLENTVIETHRGGKPNNTQPDDPSQKVCNMFKSELSTTFDLNASPDIPIIKIGNIIDDFQQFAQFQNDPRLLDLGSFPIYRFYSNYFPNAFSIFIKKEEIIAKPDDPIEQSLQKRFLIDIFQKVFGRNADFDIEYADIVEKINHESVKYFFEDSNDDTIYLLHMFMEEKIVKNERTLLPTFSIQKGAVTADQVTTEVFGMRKRNCLSSRGIKPIKDSLLILSSMSELTKNCHVTYGKTCGDGVAIELVKLYCYILKKIINLLSSDVCCDYRNLFVNGFSTRQLPTKLAGTGLGFTEIERQIEIYKNAEIISSSILQNLDKAMQILEFINNVDFKTKLVRNQDALSSVIFGDVTNIYNKNMYYKIVLKSAVKIFSDKIYELGVKQKNNYEDLYNIFKKDDWKNENKIDTCKKITNFLTSPFFLTDINDQIKNLVNNFMNKFLNLTKMINTQMATNISESRNIDNIENSFKMISSIEILLEEIYNNDKKLIRQHVLFNMIFAIRNIGERQINRYISLIFEKLINFDVIKEQIESDIYTFSDEDKYNSIRDIFNLVFKYVRRNSSMYFQKQKIKQPLNLLKYILRALKAEQINEEKTKINPNDDVNLSGFNEQAFEFVCINYDRIINNLESPCATPSVSVTNTFESAANSYQDQSQGDITPISTTKQGTWADTSRFGISPDRNTCPQDEEDISTILSPLDDDIENRFDMDEKEILDYLQENGLNIEPNQDTINNAHNQTKLVANLLNEENNEVILDQINEFINIDKSIKGDQELSSFSQQQRSTLLSGFTSIKQTISGFFASIFSQTVTTDNDQTAVMTTSDTVIGGKNIRRRNSKKNKKQKKNTIRKK
jgi:hypothetical protein